MGSKYLLAAILDIGFMRNFRKAIYDHLGILRPIFSSDTQIPTPHSVYSSIFLELMAAILNFL